MLAWQCFRRQHTWADCSRSDRLSPYPGREQFKTAVISRFRTTSSSSATKRPHKMGCSREVVAEAMVETSVDSSRVYNCPTFRILLWHEIDIARSFQDCFISDILVQTVRRHTHHNAGGPVCLESAKNIPLV
jgi:hypothetical protein